MMLSYLKLYLRQALKHRTHSLINVIGLAVALTACLLIARFVSYELSYERGYANAERLYRVEFLVDGNARSTSPAPAAQLLEENFTTIEESARLGIRKSLLARENVRFYEDRMAFADNEIFQLFDWRWIAGDPGQALADPNGVVLTQSLARKYFGTEDALGQTLLLNNAAPLQVRGVIADLPGNTHIQFDAVASLQQLDATLSFVGGMLGNWNVSGSATYIMLKPDAGIDAVAAKLPEIARRYIPQPEGGNSRGLKARPITSIHLQPTEGEARQNPGAGNLVTVIVFATTALCILLIAIANFVNLSIARYSSRAREIGLRKTTGASRTQLIVQFTGEAVLFTVMAMLLAVALAEQLTPLLTELTGDTITFDYLGEAGMLPWLIAFPLLLGIVAGLYPAIHLSALRPGLAIKGEAAREMSSLSLRNLLVLFQFSASITIIVVALVVHLQLQYTRALDLGYESEQVVVLNTPQRWNAEYANFWDTFKRELLAYPGISEVTHSMTGFLQTGDFASNFGTGAEVEPSLIPIMIVGHDFFATYGVRFVAGRDFSESQRSDLIYGPDALSPGATFNGAYVLNELAARELGWTPQEALGQALYTNGEAIPGTVIGVVSDTFKSSKDELRPIVYMNTAVPRFPGAGEISLAVVAADLPQALAHVDKVWAEHFPEEPASRVFLSDQIDALYRNENRQATLFLNFALLSIILACMGIYGLASYNAERRTREVGVRKVMGGSVWSIMLLLTNDFSRLVLVSNVIAWPVAYYAMNRWLENFAYRIDLTPLVFIGSGLIALCIAWVTVGGTAAKAASQKPVLALRYE